MADTIDPRNRRRPGLTGPRRRLPSLGAVHDNDDETRHATWLELFFDGPGRHGP